MSFVVDQNPPDFELNVYLDLSSSDALNLWKNGINGGDIVNAVKNAANPESKTIRINVIPYETSNNVASHVVTHVARMFQRNMPEHYQSFITELFDTQAQWKFVREGTDDDAQEIVKLLMYGVAHKVLHSKKHAQPLHAISTLMAECSMISCPRANDIINSQTQDQIPYFTWGTESHISIKDTWKEADWKTEVEKKTNPKKT